MRELKREAEMNKNIKILLVDDQELVRSGVRRMLEREEDMEIVGDCASAEEALSQVGSLCPHIVLMDIRMPGMDGIEACRRLKGSGQDCAVIMLTLYEDYAVEAQKAGAIGFLPKDLKREELVQAIRQVYHLRDSQDLAQNDGDKINGEIELVIPAPVDVAQLLRFLEQVEGTLQARILQTVGSWEKGTIATVLLNMPLPLAVFLDKMRSLPQVEEVKEGASVGIGASAFLRKFRTVAMGAKTEPAKRLLVTLNGASMN